MAGVGSFALPQSLLQPHFGQPLQPHLGQPMQPHLGQPMQPQLGWTMGVGQPRLEYMGAPMVAAAPSGAMQMIGLPAYYGASMMTAPSAFAAPSMATPQPATYLAASPAPSAVMPAMGPKQVAQQQVAPTLRSDPVAAPIDMTEVLAALETLYKDRLKPYGRILRKRLAERAAAQGMVAIDVDIRRLRNACDGNHLLYVQAEEGGDWSALFRGRAADFVDVYSPQDRYPAELWREAGVYFEGLHDAEMVLPGGRYSCAQALASRNLLFLANRTLGEVCHIVQLAISQKKLLGYLNGAVVPYSRSQSMVKERCAERQRPCTSAARGSGRLASWEAVRSSLQEILAGMSPSADSIPLSNIKRLFRSRFHMELSETALGHAKLSELLQDHRLRDICTVRLQGHGYVVIPLDQTGGSGHPTICLAENLAAPCPSSTDAVPSGARAPRERPPPLCLDDIVTQQPSELPDTMSGPEADSGAPQDSAPSATTGGGVAVIATPSPGSSFRRVQSLPRDLPRLLGRSQPEGGYHAFADGSCRGAAVNDMAAPEGKRAERAGAQCAAAVSSALPPSTPRRPPALVVPATPTPVSNSAFQALPSTPTPPAPLTSAPWPTMLTPCTLGNLGFSVQNTFIHAAMPPPTPPAGASCRSRSLPRNMGSDKSAVTPNGPTPGLLSYAEAARSGQASCLGGHLGSPLSGLEARVLTGAGEGPLPQSPGFEGSLPQSPGFGQRVVRLAELIPR
mmetsp:Transcript_42907/g.91434  ORF Transcript_42907/g.91434 Transcript_42907/m.91434 type:complete len:735 (-) Transcript_42907:62-2266(-)